MAFQQVFESGNWCKIERNPRTGETTVVYRNGNEGTYGPDGEQTELVEFTTPEDD